MIGIHTSIFAHPRTSISAHLVTTFYDIISPPLHPETPHLLPALGAPRLVPSSSGGSPKPKDRSHSRRSARLNLNEASWDRQLA